MSADVTPTSVSEILDRRNESRKYMQQNYWPEWATVYRYSKCLTEKIMVQDPRNPSNMIEDTSRTNVCMPETSLTIRRKTARLTAQPPQINYTSPSGNEDVAQKLTGLSYQWFDQSGESQQHRRMVHTGVTFGYSVSKLWWDSIEQTKKFQRSFIGRDGSSVAYRDRAGLMRMQGAPEDEIDDAVKPQDAGGMGPDLSDDEVSGAIAQFGNTIQVPQITKKYEGPVSRNVFIGDFFFEPGCLMLDDSGWATENYPETDQFLDKMLKMTYEDESGNTIPVFDMKAVKALEDMGTWSPNQGTQQPYDLKTLFRTSVLNQQVPLFPTKLLPGKRYDILEQHAKDEDGRMWINWVGNEKVLLGKMPYPWELYGRYCYTEFVPLFDPISAIGDSIPRLHRFLQSLHNATVGQRKDLIRNLLKPIVLQRNGEDVADEQIERAFYRLILVKDPNSFKPFIDSPSLGTAIQGAIQEEAQIMRMWGLSDPSLNNTESGTDANPTAGKTATTAVLAAKSADALTQYELDSLAYYLKQSGEKKLAMLQQNERDASEGYPIGSKFANKVEALTQRYGKTSQICIYPDEIQEDIGVEPEAMSMLSADDDIRRQAALSMIQAASQQPGIWDPYYVARFYAGTIRGVDPDKAVPQPKPPTPPPPHTNFNVTAKYPELPSQAQAALLTGVGVPDSPELQQELQLQEKMRGLVQANQAGTAADELLGPSPADQQQKDAAQTRSDTTADKLTSQANVLADRDLKREQTVVKNKVNGRP